MKILIPAGKIANVLALTNLAQVTNYGDFKRGFFEVVEDSVKVEEKPKKRAAKKSKAKTEKKSSKKIKSKKEEGSLEKIEKEVKDYTNNEE